MLIELYNELNGLQVEFTAKEILYLLKEKNND